MRRKQKIDDRKYSEGGKIRMVIIHDHRIPIRYIERLKDIFKEDIFYSLCMNGISDVYDSIRSHPDIYFFQINDDALIHAPSVPEDLLQLLRDNGVKLFEGRTDPSGEYPNTVKYNALKIDKYLLCNHMYVDPVILQVSALGEMECVSTKQGYARCSTLRVSDRGLITSDQHIAEILSGRKIDVLKVSNSEIGLPGQKSGFWGGASGNVPGGKVVLLGSLDGHPDKNKIRSFFSDKDVGLIELGGFPLHDAGSIIFAGRGYPSM